MFSKNVGSSPNSTANCMYSGYYYYYAAGYC